MNQNPSSSDIVKTSTSTPIRITAWTAAAVAAFGGVGGACSVGFLNFGAAMIKMFQIIEIIGKFLYLPIWYKGLLLEVLFSVAQLGDLVEIGPDSIVSSSESYSGRKERYWTKFTVYKEYNNVLQSVPMSSIILSVSKINFQLLSNFFRSSFSSGYSCSF